MKAATTLAGRLVARFGDPIDTPVAGLTHASPPAERIAAACLDEICAIGIVRARAEAILALAREMAEGRLSLEPRGDAEETMALLRRLPGFGEWTAQYLAMRALSWPDAFPHTDLGIRKALGDPGPKRVLELAEPWRPWRAYATMHLWKSLEKTR